MFFNLPTLFTWARIVAIPLVVGVYYMNLAPQTQNIVGTALFILFAPIVLVVPEEVMVSNVNLAMELENLSYFIQG
jgi:phosphatidylglycerophosphate synthase